MAGNILTKKKIFTDGGDTASILSILGIPGTTNRIAKFSATGLANSSLLDTGATITVNNGVYFRSSGSISRLDIQDVYFDLNNSSDYSKAWVYGDADEMSLGFGVGAGVANQIALVSDVGNTYGAFSSALLSQRNVLNDAFSTLNQNNNGVFLNSQNSVIESGVYNTVVLGGNGIRALSNNTAYLQQLGYCTDGINETLLQFTSPTGTRNIVFENASGRVLTANAVTTEVVVSDTTLTIVYNGVTYKLLALA